MAISADLPGVTITLTIKGQALREQDFPDPDPEIRTVNRLVEAQSDQIFEVKMTVDPDTTFKGTDLAFRVFVDGNRIHEPFIAQDVTTKGVPSTRTSRGLYVSPTMVRKYQFADITVVEQKSTSISSRSRSVRTSMSSMSSAPQSVPSNGIPSNSAPTNAIPTNAIPSNAIPPNAVPPSAVPAIDPPSNTTPSNASLSNARPRNTFNPMAPPLNADPADPSKNLPLYMLTPDYLARNAIPSNDTTMTSVSGAPSYSGGPSVESSRPLHETLELGTIKVEVRHTNRQARVGFVSDSGAGRAALGERAKREAAKHNITQQVKFTEPQKTSAVSAWSSEHVPDAPNPAATFIFHYRSAEGLRSMLAMAAVNALPLRPAPNASFVPNGPVHAQDIRRNVFPHRPAAPTVGKKEGEQEETKSLEQDMATTVEEPLSEGEELAVEMAQEDEEERKLMKLESVEEEVEPMDLDQSQGAVEAAAGGEQAGAGLMANEEGRRRSVRFKRKADDKN